MISSPIRAAKRVTHLFMRLVGNGYFRDKKRDRARILRRDLISAYYYGVHYYYGTCYKHASTVDVFWALADLLKFLDENPGYAATFRSLFKKMDETAGWLNRNTAASIGRSDSVVSHSDFGADSADDLDYILVALKMTTEQLANNGIALVTLLPSWHRAGRT